MYASKISLNQYRIVWWDLVLLGLLSPIFMIVDLRSDTLTQPTPGMLAAMFDAEVGDDVFGEDPTIKRLESTVADLFGHEAALFCPSGTMTNQIAIKVHTRPGTEVICDQLSHIYLYEGGGVASNSLASMRLLSGNLGRITAEQVKANINNPEDIHQPTTSLVVLENTVNKGGGVCYDVSDIQQIRSVCLEAGLSLHLDGARIFNALVATKHSPANFGTLFDSISVCLSKGLGCPVGSVLIGSKDFIQKARRVRKAMGGGIRQGGFLAAAGLYALEHHVDRLADDHARAKQLGEWVKKMPEVDHVYDIPTNIVLFSLKSEINPQEFLARWKELGILAISFGGQLIRLVTHLDIQDTHLAYFSEKIHTTL